MTINEARGILAEDALSFADDVVKEIIDWLNNSADVAIGTIENNVLSKY